MLLDGRTFNRTVRAKHAAIPWLRFEQCAAGFAFIEKLAGIGRHGFRFGMSAVGTDDGRFEDDGVHSFTFLIEDGYPAALVASVNLSAVVTVSSNCTVAVLLA
jgi:hypothetical protein